jgi:hypothetical protein
MTEAAGGKEKSRTAEDKGARDADASRVTGMFIIIIYIFY